MWAHISSLGFLGIDGAIQILNTELAKGAEWFYSNKLTHNVNKTQILINDD